MLTHTFLLKPLARSRSVARAEVRVCACGKTLKTIGNREKCVWYGVCIVWCCEVKKCDKTQEIKGKRSKHALLFRHDIAIHGTRNGPKTVIFPNALFLHFPWDLSTSLAESPIPNAQKYVFRPEVLFQKS